MKKIKLSFNKKSKGDLLAVVFFVAGVLVLVGNGLGYTVSGDKIDTWAALILQILGGAGFMRNTSTDTSPSNQVNVSSKDVSEAIELAQKFANAAVSQLAINSGLTKGDRKKSGVQQVLTNLAKVGMNLDPQIVAGVVERAYQLYKSSGGKSVDVVSTPEPEEDGDDNE